MFGVKKKLIEIFLPMLDIGLTGTAFILAYFIKKYFLPQSIRGLSIAPNYYTILLMVIIIWYMIFKYFGWILPDSRKKLVTAVKNVIKGVSAGMIIIVLCLYIFKITGVSRIMMGIFFILDLGLLSLSKFGIYRFINRYLKNGKDVRNVLIIGSKDRVKDFLGWITVDPLSNWKVLGCLEIDKSLIGQEVEGGIKIIGSINQLEDILMNNVVDEIIIAMPLKLVKNSEKHLTLAEQMGVSIRIIPDWQIYKIKFKPTIATPRFDNLLNMPTLLLSTTTVKQSQYLLKVIFDYLVATVGLTMLSPLFVLIAFSIKLASRGPVFFRQQRIGLNGRKFNMLKFRTMCVDAEIKKKELAGLNEADGPVFKIRNDPRIIPYIGKFLRKSNLDELPQFINVFKGDMSLVGPRPLPISESEKLDLWQRRRLSVKPGMTCFWQLSPNRNDISFDEWINSDLKYIDHWSLSLDMFLIVKTIRTVLTGSGR